MSTNIYILRLSNNKYYVGKSENPMKRYQEHLSGKGSTWTTKYKPIGVEKIIENVSPFDEDKYTKEYMAKYGIDNVRGGTYVSIDLDEIQEEALRREIWGAKDKCTTCGREGHWAKNCYARKDVDGNSLENDDDSSDEIIVWACNYCDKEFEEEYKCERHEKTCTNRKSKSNTCYKCGRYGHYANDCYASTHKNGYYIN